ncbi:PREDICTED: mitochondrial import inner membrane translocase subunit Tim21 [Propithecus coquereli]|nr:PREDICTED: mitochondrial import inner membrane translocase subunit Tim21 [Propithecus coquereli]
MNMTCTFFRAIQYTEKLHRSSGRRLFLPYFVLNKACLKTESSLRWGLQEQKKTMQPRCILGVTQKNIWTQGPRPWKAKEDSSKQVSVQRSQRGETAVSTSQKVKEAGRDVTYLIVVLIGIGITGGLFYTIFKELFSSFSPNKIYGKALEKCRTHPEVISIFGEPVKGYGEVTRRGRRQHVSFIEYVKDGLKHTRVKFYIEGSEPGKQGTVHVEVKENPESGECDFRYIFVEVESYPRRTIVIEDNRFQEN